jgi:pilus assembly protein CpaE
VHDSGLYLLAAPKRIEESEMVTAHTISAVLGVMRELYDFIVIDCGHHMSEVLVAAWEQSTHLFYVIEQSVSSVRPAQRFLEMFNRLGLDRLDLQFVLNRYDPHNPFSTERIEQALRRPIAAWIPRDDEAFMQLQLRGADLAKLAANRPAQLMIDDLARRLCGLSAAAESGLPLLARMRAVFLRPGTHWPSLTLPWGERRPGVTPAPPRSSPAA